MAWSSDSYIRPWWFEPNFMSTLLEEARDLGHDVRVEFDADGRTYGSSERRSRDPPQATGTAPRPPAPAP